jgi:hypothetical protein
MSLFIQSCHVLNMSVILITCLDLTVYIFGGHTVVLLVCSSHHRFRMMVFQLCSHSHEKRVLPSVCVYHWGSY